MANIELSDVPAGTWHAIASEDIRDLSKNHWPVYAKYLMMITSDKILKTESIDFDSMKDTTENKDAAKSIKEWTLCRPIEKRGDEGHKEGMDQIFSITHAANAAQKPIRTLTFNFFQSQTPSPSVFIFK